MREFLKSSGRLLRHGWFWPLVLLALPNCAIQNVEGLPPPTVEQGQTPTSTVMCDIPKFTEAVQCATDQDIQAGILLNRAAVALSETKQGFIGLDNSKAARDQCNGMPRKIEFFGEFPDGYQVCLDCDKQMGANKTYATGNDVCEVQCQNLILSAPIRPNDPFAYCADRNVVHVSTNFDKNVCYDSTCDKNAQPDPNFKTNDPRRVQEPVSWNTQNGTKNGAMGNNLQRTAGRSGNFDAGGYSKQTIARGDGWVEFEVSDTTSSYALGLSSGAADGSELLDTIDFAIVLKDGNVFVSNKGSLAGPIGAPYQVGERFRIEVVDNNDSTDPTTETGLLIAYRLNGPCAKGTQCNKTGISGQNSASLTYPLRVDASLIDPALSPGQGPMLVNVTLVRIQDLP